MPTECSAERLDFGIVEGRTVEAAFDAGLVTSDVGALLLGATDRALFLEAQVRPPKQIILDLDATDDPLHGHQEGRFFHGYYDCYCYLPLYVFCGRHLLAAKLRRSDIDAAAGSVDKIERIVRQIRARWPYVRVLLRADSGFAREALMAWCEDNHVDYVFGLARNARLVAMIEQELAAARAAAEQTGQPARRFKDFQWSTLGSWSRSRRVVAKAEWTQGEANPRFVVTSLKRAEAGARQLYEDTYCARGDMENRIKEMPARSLCRPHLGRHPARQPVAAVVRFDGLCADLRAAAHRPGRNRLCERHLRHHPTQALEGRGAGAHLRTPHQDRHGLGLSSRGRLGPRRTPPG
jgi:hypothetical protein